MIIVCELNKPYYYEPTKEELIFLKTLEPETQSRVLDYFSRVEATYVYI